MKRLARLAICIVAILSFTATFAAENEIIILAHRGGCGEGMENVEGTFKRSLDAGIRAFEIDVRITKDGYYTHENSGVPVFAGVTSVQPAELIPFSLYGQDGARPDGNLFFSSAQTLDGEEN